MDHGDDGLMTEIDDVPPPRRGPGHVRASRQVRGLIEPLLAQCKTSHQIAQELKLPIVTVNRAIAKIDGTRIRKLKARPDAEKGRLYRRLDHIAERSMAARNVLDDKGNVVEIGPKAADISNAIKATVEQVALIRPKFEVDEGHITRVLDPDLIRKVFGDPRAREALLILESITNQSIGATEPDIVVEGGEA